MMSVIESDIENGEMFRELVESSGNVVIVTDQEFNIRYASSAVLKSFDRSAGELIGRNVFDFIDQDRLQQWKSILAEQQTFSEEISIDTVDGAKAYFDAQVSEITAFGDGNAVALHLHDITGNKLREMSLLRSNQQLDQVIYKTTHDLKAPLMSALGLINLAEKSSADEKSMYIDLIKKSLLKLNSFIEDMNNFFRNEKLAVQCEKIDLAQLLHDELENLNNFPQSKKVKVSFGIEGTVPFFSDIIRVKTILTNILSNAIKYSDPAKTEPFVEILVLLDVDFCQIRITDNGIGIDSKFINRIFELFFRATTQSQGTGLGLFIVKDTVEKLKGTIEVSSVLTQGTTFNIRIPNQIHQPNEVE